MPKVSLPFSADSIDTPRARQVIYVVAIVIALGLFFLKVKPNLDQEKTLKTEAVQVTQQKDQETKALATLKKHQKKTGVKKQDLSQLILRALPTSVRNDTEYQRLNSLAAWTGVAITTYGPSEPVDGGLYQKKAISLNVTGTYENLLRFMNGLTHMTVVGKNDQMVSVGPIWTIDSVSLTPGEKNNMQLAVTGNLFMSPSSNASPATTTPPTGAAPTTTAPAAAPSGQATPPSPASAAPNVGGTP